MTAFDSRLFRVSLISCGLDTQESLAAAVGISLPRVKQIACGMIPPPELRQRIADALEVSPSDLWPECVRAGVA